MSSYKREQTNGGTSVNTRGKFGVDTAAYKPRKSAPKRRKPARRMSVLGMILHMITGA